DRNRSHWSTSKTPSYTKSVSWHHYPDSGNVYIADAVDVPVVLLFGPCCHYEQRPLGNVMLIGNDDNICSYVFETKYYFSQDREELFAVTDESLNELKRFICALPKATATPYTFDALGN
ncbi:hypothetical protein NKU63_21420, partial [Enterobacter cloacae]|nr:hypothetical protein [Enterobacter cloacae]